MLHVPHIPTAWSAAARAAALDRWTLMCNHVLRSEPRATERLTAHAGRLIALTLPTLSAALPLPTWLRADAGAQVDEVRWLISKAGLLDRVPELATSGESVDPVAMADARLALVGASPLAAVRALLSGDTAVMEVQGAPEREALVGDLRWVLDNVRWDLAADVGRVMPAPLQGAGVQAAELFTRGLKRGARAVDAWWPKSS